MPSFNVAIRGSAAAAALAAGTTAGIATAGIATAAVHHSRKAHSGVHHLLEAHSARAQERLASTWAGTYADRFASYVAARYKVGHHHPPTTTTPTTTTPTTTTPTTTTPTTTTPTTTTPTTTTPTTTTPTTTTPTTTTPTTTTPTTTTPTTTTPTTTTPTTTTPTTTTPTTTTPTTTTPTTTTPTTTTPTTTTPTTTTPTTTTPVPDGMPGNWTMTFDDEFNGTSLDTSLWSNRDGWTNQNNVTDHAYNLSEGGGYLTLNLASSTSGAAIGSNQYAVGVGDFAQARVYFAGSGTTIYNWPAWWISGPNWPAAGESDVAEGLGTLTVNYHSPAGAFNTGTVAGTWSNAFHTYGIYRGSTYCDVYYDGQLVRHYTTSDNGAAEQLIFTMGAANTLQFGTASQMKVDYVRVWAPA